MNLRSGAFDITKDTKVNVSHLSAAFGLPEVCAELIELLAIPEFEQAWVQYCVLYNASAEQQRAETGRELRQIELAARALAADGVRCAHEARSATRAPGLG